jgi:3D (Asp-Asp-Asp) domain-containing protein
MKKFVGGVIIGILVGANLFWIIENYTLFVENKKLSALQTTIRVTAYSPDPVQTVGDPFRMASGRRASVKDLYKFRYCAVSPDLKRKLGIRYGDKLVILVEMELEVQDLTSKRIENTIDLFLRSRELAKGWGVKKAKIVRIERF